MCVLPEGLIEEALAPEISHRATHISKISVTSPLTHGQLLYMHMCIMQDNAALRDVLT